jgi:hypothetical protein
MRKNIRLSKLWKLFGFSHKNNLYKAIDKNFKYAKIKAMYARSFQVPCICCFKEIFKGLVNLYAYIGGS